ncbi:MAG: transposase [Caldilineaceae bacterium SB0662_bin_9]|uniref:Transposase n=1 Tax=Caldilineaceae bacterium SB0662_bin_9 TaxID=2605258 RepID=A0A6B1DSK1_9CHLR|nr:transposase [Caldilineaceae bacterium SB0662_bin_9]
MRSAGWAASCQAGVFAAYAGEGGATRVHQRLFLAGAAASAERRQRCGVPEEAATFRTKPQLSLELLIEQVCKGSLPARWVSCDEGYGRSTSKTGLQPRAWATWRRCRSTRGSGRSGRPRTQCRQLTLQDLRRRHQSGHDRMAG